jgi:ABC-type transport system involved in cytochrome c biogenesis permease subunit
MLTPLLLMGLAYSLIFAALLLVSMRAEITERRVARLEHTARAPSEVTIT